MYTREEETTEESEHKLEIGLKGKWHNPFLLFSVSVPHTGPTHGCICLFVCLNGKTNKRMNVHHPSIPSLSPYLSQEKLATETTKTKNHSVYTRVSLVPGLKRITPSLSWSLPCFSTSFFFCAHAYYDNAN